MDANDRKRKLLKTEMDGNGTKKGLLSRLKDRLGYSDYKLALCFFLSAIFFLVLNLCIFSAEALMWNTVKDHWYVCWPRSVAESDPFAMLTAWIRRNFTDDSLEKYTDIVVAVLEAIIVALLTITLTMYTFLKGNLDRSIDENPYLSKVASIFQREGATRLIGISILNLFSMIMIMLWHFRIRFGSVKAPVAIFSGLSLLLLSLILNTINILCFWVGCIQLQFGLKKVCTRYEKEQIKNIKDLLADRFKTKAVCENFKEYCKLIHFLIGDWNEWHTELLDEYRSKQAEDNLRIVIKNHDHVDSGFSDEEKKEIETLIACGQRLCDEMESDEFINFFSRTEALLLNSNKKDADKDFDENGIVTLIQERAEVLDPIIKPESSHKEEGMEVKDLQDFKYDLGDENEGDIVKYIDYFRRRVGYTDHEDNYRYNFLEETEKLYKYLRDYRNVKVSQRQLQNDTKDKTTDPYVVLGMYYFYLRVLCVFCIAVNIHDYTDNGSTMNFADFYSSTMEKVTLYSSQFYHTVFARSKWINCVLDVSAFDNVLFYYTRLSQTSLANSHFREVIFKNAQMSESMLDRGMFVTCGFENSVFKEASLNNSVFENTLIKGTDFSKAQLENIKWGNTIVSDSSFENAAIKGWYWSADGGEVSYRKWDNNVYSGASIEHVKWEKMNLENSIFSKADMPGVIFEKCRLNGSIFDQANLAGSTITECEQYKQSESSGQPGKCSFKNVNFYNSSISKSIFPDSNFSGASFTEADINICDLSYGDFNDTSFKRANLAENTFRYDRLYEASFSNAKITECIFDNALADRMLFTYVLCHGSSFKKTSMDDSNFSGSVFEQCELNAAGMSGSVFYDTAFDNCGLIHVDLSGGRFADAEFRNRTRFEYCNFSNCRFERVKPGDAQFIYCDFTGAEFVECCFDENYMLYCKGLT